jgi:hypothetical protein
MSAGLVLAHPHFDKTVTAKLGAVTATITYNTTPSNEGRATNSPVGQFVTPRAPQINFSAEVKAGTVTVPGGNYTIGVIKNSATDWTMALYPGRPGQGGVVDATKLIKLDSIFMSGQGLADHMLIDVTPGKGKFEGKAVLTLHFGNLFLSGLIG